MLSLWARRLVPQGLAAPAALIRGAPTYVHYSRVNAIVRNYSTSESSGGDQSADSAATRTSEEEEPDPADVAFDNVRNAVARAFKTRDADAIFMAKHLTADLLEQYEDLINDMSDDRRAIAEKRYGAQVDRLKIDLLRLLRIRHYDGF